MHKQRTDSSPWSSAVYSITISTIPILHHISREEKRAGDTFETPVLPNVGLEPPLVAGEP